MVRAHPQRTAARSAHIRRGIQVSRAIGLGQLCVLQERRQNTFISHLQVQAESLCICTSFPGFVPSNRQQRTRSSAIGEELQLALTWWLEVLQFNLCEKHLWQQVTQPCARMLCDARSHPPRVAAVLFIDRKVYWSDWEPSEEVLRSFKQRRDGQIMALELLSVAFGMSPFGSASQFCVRCASWSGLSAFQDLLQGRNLHIFSDNVGAECAMRRNKARSWDHTCIVHGIW